MNSKQRRALRVFIHEVTIEVQQAPIITHYDFDNFNDHVSAAKAWLQINTKHHKWMVSHSNYRHTTFKFRDAAIATLFALKFS